MQQQKRQEPYRNTRVMRNFGHLTTMRTIDGLDPAQDAPMPAGDYAIVNLREADHITLQLHSGDPATVRVYTSISPTDTSSSQTTSFEWVEQRLEDGSLLFATPGAIKVCSECLSEDYLKIESGAAPADVRISLSLRKP